MTNFQVPTKETVSENNKAIFNQLEEKLGFLPNLYATYAYSENALSNHLSFSSVNTSLNNKEKEVVNLAVSQVNECLYCLAAHTAIGKMNGFTDEQILEVRSGKASFDKKLDALAQQLLSLGLISRYVIAKCNAIVMIYREGKSQQSLNQLDVLLKKYSLSVLSRNVFDEAPGINEVLLALSKSAVVHLSDSFLRIYNDVFDDIKPMHSIDLASLTDKEVKIYQLLKSGLSNQDISNEMNVALSTTKWHLKNIYQKLGVKNRAEILVMNNREPLMAAQSSMT